MSKTRPPYPAEFRQKLVELVRSGRSYGDLSKEFKVSYMTIRKWVANADRIDQPDSPKSIAMTEAEELKALRKENRILREERDILKKAAAWFAQETGVPSSKRSS